MQFNCAVCGLCNQFMNFRQVREAVYWLPDMDRQEWLWACYEGFEHRLAHRFCWKRLKEKQRAQIRYLAFKGQEPRSMGQLI